MRAERVVLGSWLASTLAVTGMLVPKCPLCLALYLCLFGLSAGSARAVASVAPALCLGVLSAALFGAALLLVRSNRRSRRSKPGGASACCQG